MSNRQKGRAAPIDHQAVLRERLGRAAYEAAFEHAPVPWQDAEAERKERYRRIGMAVLAQLTTASNQRGEIEVASIISRQNGQPMVDLWVSISPSQFSPGKAREIALMLLEAADAAESDAALNEFARAEMGLDDVQVAGLVGRVRALRERRRGKAVGSV